MPRSTDRIELTWLVTVRWTSTVASIAGLLFGHSALGVDGPVAVAVLAVAAAAASNIWLHQRTRRATPLPSRVPGALVALDAIVLAGCLFISGGVLNPASIFFLVDIVLAALVLGRAWTIGVTALSVVGYGLQLVAPTSELSAAAVMHPQIGEHMRGMWWAFVLTAVIVGLLVSRLALAVERRDRALDALRADAERQRHMMSLASMAAGAAHELSTPLATIAVAAGELAHSIASLPGGDTLSDDVQLIRSELNRARRILTDLSGRAEDGASAFEQTTARAIVDAVASAMAPDLRARVSVTGDADTRVTWPRLLMQRALGNVIGNALQASADGAVTVHVNASTGSSSQLTVRIVDTGAGMSPATLARVGEPFFTTRPNGAGMGLGVFVTRASVEQFGGSLTLQSTPADGTTVTITMPLEVPA